MRKVYTMMNIKKNNFLIAILFIFIFSFAAAQQMKTDSTKPARQVNVDKAKVNNRTFDEEKLNSYRNNDAYNYGEKIEPPGNSILSRMINWILRKLFRPLTNPKTYTYTEYILITICALIVIYAILKLTKSDWLNVFSRKSKNALAPDFEELEENIHEMNFDQLIDQALQDKNYTRAVRLSYLKVLKILSDRQLIDWRINKTNHDYLYEVGKTNFEPEFRRLTFIFEYVCYGNFPIQQSEFQNISETFKSFERKVR